MYHETSKTPGAYLFITMDGKPRVGGKPFNKSVFQEFLAVVSRVFLWRLTRGIFNNRLLFSIFFLENFLRGQGCDGG